MGLQLAELSLHLNMEGREGVRERKAEEEEGGTKDGRWSVNYRTKESEAKKEGKAHKTRKKLRPRIAHCPRYPFSKQPST